ncbi:MAG: MFS transporter, partial [Spirochaetia bacterium]|nr:MFS transporter [Spirochaetia bacterium]
SWSSGTVVGPLLTGVLSDLSSSWPIRAGAVIFLTVIALVLAARLLYSHTDPVPHRAKKIKAVADHSTILRFPAWIGVFTSHTLIGIILNIFPVFARRELHFSKTLIGALLLFRAAATATTFISMGRLHFWHKNRTFLIVLQVALALASALMIFPNQVFLIGVFLALLGVLIAMSYMSSIYHGVDGAPNKSARMAVHEILLTLGILLGAYAGGWLYEWRGVAAVWLGASGLLIVGLAAMVFFTGAKKSL